MKLQGTGGALLEFSRKVLSVSLHRLVFVGEFMEFAQEIALNQLGLVLESCKFAVYILDLSLKGGALRMLLLHL